MLIFEKFKFVTKLSKIMYIWAVVVAQLQTGYFSHLISQV